MIKITKDAVRGLLESSHGLMLSVFFHKKDGSERWMNGRLFVKKGVKGTGPEVPKHLLTIFDVKAKDHRRIIPEKIEIIRMEGKEYQVV